MQYGNVVAFHTVFRLEEPFDEFLQAKHLEPPRRVESLPLESQERRERRAL